MKKRIKLCLTALSIILGVKMVVNFISNGITRLLVEVALDRNEPKRIVNGFMERGLSKEMREYKSYAKTAADNLKKQNLEEVFISSYDGIVLVGHWQACKNAKRTIIAVHGWRASWDSNFGVFAQFWKENDCNVLFVEQRGQNSSGGDYMGFGMLERYDICKWIDWVNSMVPDTLPIYLSGVSMGASTVLMTTGFELPPNVKGVIADCGYTSAYDIWKNVVEKKMHLSYKARCKKVDKLCRQKINMNANSYTVKDALTNSEVPVLFIHGTEDRLVPVEMSYENYKACSAPKMLLVVPGADHGMSYYVDKNNYETIVKSFWKEWD